MSKTDKKEKRRFHLSFHGSRSLKDERVKIIILEEIKKHNPTTVITHAEPDGVCGIARSVCREKAVPLKLHFLNFRYLRGAFEHRSKDVLNDSDYSVFIHDGESKGTLNERKLAEKMNIPLSYHKLRKIKHKKSVGFEIDTEWDKISMEKMFDDFDI